jgi:hypothetical protein
MGPAAKAIIFRPKSCEQDRAAACRGLRLDESFSGDRPSNRANWDGPMTECRMLSINRKFLLSEALRTDANWTTWQRRPWRSIVWGTRTPDLIAFGAKTLLSSPTPARLKSVLGAKVHRIPRASPAGITLTLLRHCGGASGSCRPTHSLTIPSCISGRHVQGRATGNGRPLQICAVLTSSRLYERLTLNSDDGMSAGANR